MTRRWSFRSVCVSILIGMLVLSLRPMGFTPAAFAADACATAGNDGPVGTITGIINSYYPSAATATTGATTINVGVMRAGLAAPIAVGDLLLVIQMQDAVVNSSNTSSYGNGSGTGRGVQQYNNSGFYEYVVAAGSVRNGLLSIKGTGTNNGLNRTYTHTDATTTQGQRRFQVVRVPQYSSVTLATGLSALPWDGRTGGILSLDVSGTLNLGGAAVNVNGLGFRGGGGRQLSGSSSGATTDYVTPSTNNNHASKGEGIAGTPRYILDSSTNAVVHTNPAAGDGYPAGSHARGAPANAGGGATDGNPIANDHNAGGGGGSNGGNGGNGGNSAVSNLTVGGIGAGSFGSAGTGRVVLGGGGGAGSANVVADVPANGIASSGAGGGGIVLVRTGSISGTGSITANGTSTSPDSGNDGSGGGGAGGSVVFLARNGTLNGLTVHALGGNGGSNTGGTSNGPGGGGSGGVIALSDNTAKTSVAKGLNGTTVGGAYGASAGDNGKLITTATATQISGVQAGAACFPILSVATTTSTPTVINTPTGTTATYTITVANAAGQSTATDVTLAALLPVGFTYATTDAVTLNNGATRTSINEPSADTATPRFGTFAIPGGATVSITFAARIAPAVNSGTYGHPAQATYADPARVAASDTLTAAYDSAANAAEDVTVTASDLAIATTHPTGLVRGATGTYTLTVTNSGTAATNGAVSVLNTLPEGLTPTVATGTDWLCTVDEQQVRCERDDDLAASASYPPIMIHARVAQHVASTITNTASVSGGGQINTTNDRSTTQLEITSSADLNVTKQVDRAIPNPGDGITYTIEVRNFGPSDAEAVRLSDVLPDGITYTRSTATQGSYDPASYVWTVGNIAANERALLTITTEVQQNTGGTTIANTTSDLRTDTPDPTKDNNVGAVNITVNRPPIAADDAIVTDEDVAIGIDVLENDTDTDGTVVLSTLSITTQPAVGSLSLDATHSTITYTPNRDSNGLDHFTYRICDDRGACATARASITVTPVDDAPLANDDQAATNEDTAITINVLTNDTDVDGDLPPLTMRIITAPTHGTARVEDGSVRYTPNANYHGPDSFAYTICETAHPTLCTSASVALTIASVNDAPVAHDDTATTQKNTAVTIDVRDNDTDVDSASSALRLNALVAPAHGTATINNDGAITYTPNLNYVGTDTFTYESCDQDEAPLCDSATVTITVIDPTNIALRHFTAVRTDNTIVVRWETTAESGLSGFNVYRSEAGERISATKITPELIMSRGQNGGGAVYAWVDSQVAADRAYTYWLRVVALDGTNHEYGPVTVERTAAPSATQYRVFVPFVLR